MDINNIDRDLMKKESNIRLEHEHFIITYNCLSIITREPCKLEQLKSFLKICSEDQTEEGVPFGYKKGIKLIYTEPTNLVAKDTTSTMVNNNIFIYHPDNVLQSKVNDRGTFFIATVDGFQTYTQHQNAEMVAIKLNLDEISPGTEYNDLIIFKKKYDPLTTYIDMIDINRLRYGSNETGIVGEYYDQRPLNEANVTIKGYTKEEFNLVPPPKNCYITPEDINKYYTIKVFDKDENREIPHDQLKLHPNKEYLFKLHHLNKYEDRNSDIYWNIDGYDKSVIGYKPIQINPTGKYNEIKDDLKNNGIHKPNQNITLYFEKSDKLLGGEFLKEYRHACLSSYIITSDKTGSYELENNNITTAINFRYGEDQLENETTIINTNVKDKSVYFTNSYIGNQLGIIDDTPIDKPYLPYNSNVLYNELKIGQYENRNKIINDDINGIYIPRGLELTIYTNENFETVYKIFSAKDKDIYICTGSTHSEFLKFKSGLHMEYINNNRLNGSFVISLIYPDSNNGIYFTDSLIGKEKGYIMIDDNKVPIDKPYDSINPFFNYGLEFGPGEYPNANESLKRILDSTLNNYENTLDGIFIPIGWKLQIFTEPNFSGDEYTYSAFNRDIYLCSNITNTDYLKHVIGCDIRKWNYPNFNGSFKINKISVTSTDIDLTIEKVSGPEDIMNQSSCTFKWTVNNEEFIDHYKIKKDDQPWEDINEKQYVWKGYDFGDHSFTVKAILKEIEVEEPEIYFTDACIGNKHGSIDSIDIDTPYSPKDNKDWYEQLPIGDYPNLFEALKKFTQNEEYDGTLNGLYIPKGYEITFYTENDYLGENRTYQAINDGLYITTCLSLDIFSQYATNINIEELPLKFSVSRDNMTGSCKISKIGEIDFDITQNNKVIRLTKGIYKNFNEKLSKLEITEFPNIFLNRSMAIIIEQEINELISIEQYSNDSYLYITDDPIDENDYINNWCNNDNIIIKSKNELYNEIDITKPFTITIKDIGKSSNQIGIECAVVGHEWNSPVLARVDIEVLQDIENVEEYKCLNSSDIQIELNTTDYSHEYDIQLPDELKVYESCDYRCVIKVYDMKDLDNPIYNSTSSNSLFYIKGKNLNQKFIIYNESSTGHLKLDTGKYYKIVFTIFDNNNTCNTVITKTVNNKKFLEIKEPPTTYKFYPLIETYDHNISKSSQSDLNTVIDNKYLFVRKDTDIYQKSWKDLVYKVYSANNYRKGNDWIENDNVLFLDIETDANNKSAKIKHTDDLVIVYLTTRDFILYDYILLTHLQMKKHNAKLHTFIKHIIENNKYVQIDASKLIEITGMNNLDKNEIGLCEDNVIITNKNLELQLIPLEEEYTEEIDINDIELEISKISGPVDTIVNFPNIFKWKIISGEALLDHFEIKLDDGEWINYGRETQYTWSNMPTGSRLFTVRAIPINSNGNDIITRTKTINLGKLSGISGNTKESDIEFKWEMLDNQNYLQYFEMQQDGGPWINIGENTQYLWREIEEGEHTFKIRVVEKEYRNTETNIDIREVNRQIANIMDDSYTFKWDVINDKDLSHFEVQTDNMEEWIDIDKQNYYTWENIPLGQRMFKVQAIPSEFMDTNEIHIRKITKLEGGTEGDSYLFDWSVISGFDSLDYFEIKKDSEDWINIGAVTEYEWKNIPKGPHIFKVRAIYKSGIKMMGYEKFYIDNKLPRIIENDKQYKIRINEYDVNGNIFDVRWFPNFHLSKNVIDGLIKTTDNPPYIMFNDNNSISEDKGSIIGDYKGYASFKTLKDYGFNFNAYKCSENFNPYYNKIHALCLTTTGELYYGKILFAEKNKYDCTLAPFIEPLQGNIIYNDLETERYLYFDLFNLNLYRYYNVELFDVIMNFDGELIERNNKYYCKYTSNKDTLGVYQLIAIYKETNNKDIIYYDIVYIYDVLESNIDISHITPHIYNSNLYYKMLDKKIKEEIITYNTDNKQYHKLDTFKNLLNYEDTYIPDDRIYPLTINGINQIDLFNNDYFEFELDTIDIPFNIYRIDWEVYKVNEDDENWLSSFQTKQYNDNFIIDLKDKNFEDDQIDYDYVEIEIKKVTEIQSTMEDSTDFIWEVDVGEQLIHHYEIRKDNDTWINIGLDTSYTWNGYNDGYHTFEVKAFSKRPNMNGNEIKNNKIKVKFTEEGNYNIIARVLTDKEPSDLEHAIYSELLINKLVMVEKKTVESTDIIINQPIDTIEYIIIEDKPLWFTDGYVSNKDGEVEGAGINKPYSEVRFNTGTESIGVGDYPDMYKALGEVVEPQPFVTNWHEKTLDGIFIPKGSSLTMYTQMNFKGEEITFKAIEEDMYICSGANRQDFEPYTKGIDMRYCDCEKYQNGSMKIRRIDYEDANNVIINNRLRLNVEFTHADYIYELNIKNQNGNLLNTFSPKIIKDNILDTYVYITRNTTSIIVEIKDLYDIIKQKSVNITIKE